MPFEDFMMLDYVTNIIDILVVWFVIYKLIMVIKGTKAVQLLKGIFVIIIVQTLSNFLGFTTLSAMMEQVIEWGFLAIIIIFQPELRRALEQLGRGRIFTRSGNQEEEETKLIIDHIGKSISYMAKRRIGALLSIERETGLGDYIETGIPIQSKITSELLINIFIPNTPLHDGAVILQKNQLAAAACYLPLSESAFISKELGTRHRAAIGISEVTDAITIIVSEETGAVSLSKNGKLHRGISVDELKKMLSEELLLTSKGKQNNSSLFSMRGKRND